MAVSVQNITSPALWVILPTFCEAENLPVISDRLFALEIGLNLLVVDDNSPDGTGEIAADLCKSNANISLLRREEKQGLGAAYLAGFRFVAERGAELVVTMDCDLSHDPAVLPALIEASRNAACAVGSRYINGGEIKNWPFRRLILSSAANRFVRTLFRLQTKDCTSGYRVYRRSVIDDILADPPRSQGYSFQVEALRIAARGPQPVIEVPICFVERVAGKSKMGIGEIVHGAIRLLQLFVNSK